MTKRVIPADPAAFIFRLLPLLTTRLKTHPLVYNLAIINPSVYACSPPASWSHLFTSHTTAIAPFLLNDVRVISPQDQHGNRPQPRVPAAKEANLYVPKYLIIRHKLTILKQSPQETSKQPRTSKSHPPKPPTPQHPAQTPAPQPLLLPSKNKNKKTSAPKSQPPTQPPSDNSSPTPPAPTNSSATPH